MKFSSFMKIFTYKIGKSVKNTLKFRWSQFMNLCVRVKLRGHEYHQADKNNWNFYYRLR